MKKFLKYATQTALLAFLLSCPVCVSAQVAADFTGSSNNGFQADLTLGWSFEVSESIVIDGLGFFDDFASDGEGLHHDHRVAIWTDEQDPQLIVESTITNGSACVWSRAEDGCWMMNDVGPITLSPGNYVIGAHDPFCGGGGDCDRYRFFVDGLTIPEVTILQGRTGQGWRAPLSPHDVLDGYFGPTFRVMNIVVPSSLNVTRGNPSSESSRVLRLSDDADLSIVRSSTDIQSVTEFELSAVVPFETPSRMTITLEASVFARTPVFQTVELFDYVANDWEEVGGQSASRFIDSVMQVDISGDPTRFVEPSTMKVEARVRFQSANPRQSFSSNIDHFNWNVGE